MSKDFVMWTICGASLILAGLAPRAEKRQANRKNLDRPGWVSWPLVQIIAIIGVVVSAVLALKPD
jgi:uncharacterized membrane protein YidH (DUF202 family)